jgi:hypothetical protein
MCKDVPVIPVDRVVDKKKISGKREGLEVGNAQGVVDPKRAPERQERVL